MAPRISPQERLSRLNFIIDLAKSSPNAPISQITRQARAYGQSLSDGIIRGAVNTIRGRPVTKPQQDRLGSLIRVSLQSDLTGKRGLSKLEDFGKTVGKTVANQLIQSIGGLTVNVSFTPGATGSVEFLLKNYSEDANVMLDTVFLPKQKLSNISDVDQLIDDKLEGLRGDLKQLLLEEAGDPSGSSGQVNNETLIAKDVRVTYS